MVCWDGVVVYWDGAVVCSDGVTGSDSIVVALVCSMCAVMSCREESKLSYSIVVVVSTVYLSPDPKHRHNLHRFPSLA